MMRLKSLTNVRPFALCVALVTAPDDDPSQPIGKQYVPGGSLNDYFFPAAPRWTVGNALARILTKVKNNPSNSVRFSGRLAS